MDPEKSSRKLGRRQFLFTGGLAAAGFLMRGGATPLAAETKTSPKPPHFSVAPLGYGYDALEPYIDATTMEIHHSRHYAGYVRNLNQALEESGWVGPEDLGEMISDIGAVPKEIRTTVRNNGGGAHNHEIFWKILGPSGRGGSSRRPDRPLRRALERSFGSVESFQDAFNTAAGSVFGSGWAWLCKEPGNGNLFITTTPNQDSPLMRDIAVRNGKPILGVDVWEHAYYLHYQNRRGDYLNAFWECVDWEKVSELSD